MLKIDGHVLNCNDENVFGRMFINFVEGNGWSFNGMILDDTEEKEIASRNWAEWYESIDGDCGCNCLACEHNTVCDDAIEDIEL